MPAGDQYPHYRFADLLVDVGRRSVLRDGSEIHLGKLSFDLLHALIEGAPNVVSNEEISRRVWQGVVVSPETVTQRVKLLRDALGDEPDAPRYIVGLRGQGYRLLPPVTLEPNVALAATSDGGQAVPAQTARRRVGIVLATTALAVVVAYFTADQLLSSKRGEAAERESAVPAGGSVHASESPTNSSIPAPALFAPAPRSVAVLPFVNMSGDPDQEYLSDGLSEELLNRLSRIKELQVAARTSSFSFKGKDTDVGTIARKLNVGAVLEGSVRRSAATVRVTVQLDDALTGFRLWSETYDRDASDILKLQAQIADAVASALKVTLLSDDTARIELGGTGNPAAFDAYLRATKASRNASDLGPLQTAIAAYTQAIRLDPNYALALAGRSLALTEYGGHHVVSATIRDSFDRAQRDARTAIALAPDLAEAHLALGMLSLYGSLDFRSASEEFERAVALAPGNARVLRTYGRFAADMGRSDAGIAAARSAALLDPLNPAAHRTLGLILYESRRYNEAIAAAQNSLAIDPDNPDAYAVRGLAYYGLGDFQRARSSCEASANYPLSRICLALTDDKLGRHAEAQDELKRLQALGGEAAAYQYAEICSQFGNIEAALKWLDTAARIRDPGLGWLKVDPLLDPLRGDPRFQAIERALKFPT